jgi:hypothetical protein
LVEKGGEKLPAPISLKNLYQLLYKRSNDGSPTRFYKTGKGSMVCRVGRKGAG